ncbi:hypothetical protein [Nocardia sp. alder85J]|uniref:hypothetical protein n=1 Tax=Nocardia sp. alder85J TaxID=2862949 RepID=UPI001CD3D067|nr:hypothetical protein [Nocardia sp. alder85J]MCX4092195.1 hypothetical protein [Nocardia sp. alder85J]
MAASGLMIADPTQLSQSSKDTATCLGELESYLKALMSTQAELQTAVQSQHTGQAIYNALANAQQAGTKLAGTLDQIVNALQQAGVKVDTQDLEGGSKVDAVAGLGSGSGGVLNAGATGGTWNKMDFNF